MPLFYFDIHDDNLRSMDTVGTEYVGVREAQADAIRMLVAIAQDEWHEGFGKKLAVQICDETRRPVMEAKINCAITTLAG
ncbi:hypothetical protein D3227_32095 [Mesorhizobium waimense]|uniref:DUF6894 domain-containing protein n=1 Tax=Mesorhizobium waimense TaxID=1300307 RepID=A0A3A5KAN8_9HYPH|nr:hypothetical protein [Mesorhizobium waimense]RJT29413.1 hypothetical protein D3227_32095 [Mesorhizobium waimense]